ncbi:unnamed protein product [Bursaphelenchus xylophilus]|uniref:GATOR complex protein NPRL3 n=1 Tax=Bursaphelenchus xylophilus TaxID=6326 RepID=A0A1I7RHZ6_BURXY|nr:unnamed protein product [Bursaphelenchus xylophilus]CAG9115265.1 unnamed protein product [Bursaphelenchus xylophilus]
MPQMKKNERPLGIVLIAKDDTPERILFKFPYVIDIPQAAKLSENSSESSEALNSPESQENIDDEMDFRPNGKCSLEICNKRIDPNEIKKDKKEERVPCFPVKMLAALLQPKEEVREVPFEIKVDNVRYAGVPWQVNKAGQCISIIFVLPGTCSNYIVEAFQSLSRKLVVAIHSEEMRCSFLKEQIHIIQPLLDKAESSDDESYNPFVDIEGQSKLARSLRDVYEEICEHGIVDVFINDCIQVGFCVEPNSLNGVVVTPNPSRDVEILMESLQPYHTILFFEDCAPSPDCNPFFIKFVEHHDIEKSIEEISFSSNMPLPQVKDVVRHCLLWARAKVIYPICSSNLYSTAQSEVITQRTQKAFKEQFPEVSLPRLLARFHPPCTLAEFLEEASLYTKIQIRKQMLIFLLRNNFLTQLHTYLFLMPPSTQVARFKNPVSDAEMVLLSNRIKTQLRQVKDSVYRDALTRISVDAQKIGLAESEFFWLLSTFLSLKQFLNGEFHIEAIMYNKKLDRSTLSRIFDMFSDVLAPFLCMDFVETKMR